MKLKSLAVFVFTIVGLLASIDAAVSAQGRTNLRAAIFPPTGVGPQPTLPTAFDLTGHIQAATVDVTGNAICRPASARLAGGTVTVNGITITIPCDTILQLPATSMTWADLFSQGDFKTHLALTDLFSGNVPLHDAPLPAYQIRVQGNILPNPKSGMQEYIAGLVFISQDAANIGQGYIKSIDYVTGELCISSTRPSAGFSPQTAESPLCQAPDAQVRINDPIGRFGKRHGSTVMAEVVEVNYDPRFTADTDNPTIRAETGYPMCIPRMFPFDPVNGDRDYLCPQQNRPLQNNGLGCQNLPPANGALAVNGINFPAFPSQPDGYCHHFVMNPLPTNPPPPGGACTGLDPLNNNAPMPCPTRADRQAPFEVGDYVDYSGTLTVDPFGDARLSPYYISAHTIVGHLGIFTYPGTKPAYVVIDDLLAGTNGQPYANIAQEATSRIRVEGHTTDPASIIDIYAMDQDQKTGLIKDRLLANVSASGPPVIGRFRYVPAAGAFMPATRNIRVVTRALCNSNSVPCTLPQAGTLDPDLLAGMHANGLVAGQYNAPNFEFIFPENLFAGDQILPNNFQDLAFLACGSGPLNPAEAMGADNPVVGPLDPKPWSASMPQQTASFCANSVFANVPPTMVNGGAFADIVTLVNATWDNRQGKGKLSVTATSSIPATAANLALGLQLYVQADDGFPDPVTGAGYLGATPLPMTLIINTAPVAPATAGPCGAGVPIGQKCWSYAATGTILDPGLCDPNSQTACSVLLAPQNVTIYSSFGGIATAGPTDTRIFRLR